MPKSAINRLKLKERTVSGLRTRYFPKSRIGQGTVSVAPWVDIILLAAFFLLVGFRSAVQPGFVINLPRKEASQASPVGKVAVVMSVGAAGDEDRRHVVFFDDERFLVDRQDQYTALRETIARWSSERGDATLIIQADRDVAHGVVAGLIDIATEAGVRRINLATRSG
ncbi:MAG: biopolymer transporter ExbD [Kiritimatiellia bacterium]